MQILNVSVLSKVEFEPLPSTKLLNFSPVTSPSLVASGLFSVVLSGVGAELVLIASCLGGVASLTLAGASIFFKSKSLLCFLSASAILLVTILGQL
jgi:hypothetical protein